MPIILPNYQTDNINKKDKTMKSFTSELDKTRVTDRKLANYISWGWKNGKYYIDEEKEKSFMKKYAHTIKYGLPGDQPVTVGQMPKNYSPIYSDIDLRKLKAKCSHGDSKLYTEELLTELVRIYQQAIDFYYETEEDQKICCVFEKDGLEDKEPYWGSGIHLIFPNTVCSVKLRYLIRDYVVKKCEKKGLFEEFDNCVNDIIDISIVDRNCILLYGSKKPTSKYFYNYTKCFDDDTNEIDPDDIFGEAPDFVDYVKCFSLRKKGHREDKELILNKKIDPKYIEKEYAKLGFSTTETFSSKPVIVDEKVISEVEELVKMLSPERAVSYDSWIKVGWCLFNIDSSLWNLFDEFSKSSELIAPGKYKGTYDIKKHWANMKKRELTISSLKYWAREDSPLEYEKYYQDRFAMTARDSLEGQDYLVAKAFREKYGNRFVCASLEGRPTWYEFSQYSHRWKPMPAAYTIQKLLPEDFSNQWIKISQDLNAKIISSTGAERSDYLKQQKQVTTIVSNLNKTSFRKNIVENLSTLYYHHQFNEKLDEVNKDAICCDNGVIDLISGKLREGRPDDFMSLSTNVNYIPYNEHHPVMKEVHEFFEKVLPDKDVRKYFLLAVCSCLSGRNRDQKLFICTGVGSNGKSVTFDLIKKALGDYFQAVRVELLTRKSQGSGQANEDLVGIKSKRCGYFQEPDTNETFNAGLMKQMTAGNDTITARKLHQSNISFVPQMKYFMACNDPPIVKDNTDGTWRRLRLIKFKSRFVNKPLERCNPKKFEFPIDDTIEKKLDDWAPFFFSYLVHLYTTVYMVEGLIEPKSVTMHTDKYKSENDYFMQFAEKHIEFIDPETKEYKTSRVRLDKMWEKFKTWYSSEYQMAYREKKNKLFEFFDSKLDQPGNKKWYIGIVFKAEEMEESSGSDDEKNEKADALG